MSGYNVVSANIAEREPKKTHHEGTVSAQESYIRANRIAARWAPKGAIRCFAEICQNLEIARISYNPPEYFTISCERQHKFSRDYFIASNRPTGRDLFALLAQGYGFWHRISIAHSCINQKKPTRPPLFQCLVPPDHGAVFIVNPDRNPLVRLLETAQSPSSFENFVPPLP